jgi:hypothetical protein
VAEITGWHGRMTPRNYAALTPLVCEQVNQGFEEQRDHYGTRSIAIGTPSRGSKRSL